MIQSRVAILAIGDELVRGEKLDTNTHWLAGQLVDLGCSITEHRTIGDDRAAIAAILSQLAANADCVITTGGLGPTTDDLTRHALGDHVSPGQELIADDIALEHLRAIFRSLERMPESNRRQIWRPVNARMVDNPNGTAMGLHAMHDGCTFWSLPGPPREMKPMFTDHVAPTFKEQGDVTKRVTVHAFGLGESAAGERLGELLDRDADPLVGITAGSSIVAASIRTTGPAADVEERVESVALEIEARWKPYVFGRDGLALASCVGALLQQKNEMVATVESCTGGWIGKMIVDQPGSSAWYAGGWVTYSNDLKINLVDVPRDTIKRNGAVSKQTALAMAAGGKRHSGAHWSVAVTGVAGPEASESKPAGCVFIAVDGPDDVTDVRQFQFRGDRNVVRERSAMTALQMLRLNLLDQAADTQLLWQRDLP